MPSRFGDDIIVYATTSKLPGFTALEFVRPIAGLPERVAASCHRRLIPSVGKRALASLNAADSSSASSNSAGISSPAASSVSAMPLSQKAAQLVGPALVSFIARIPCVDHAPVMRMAAGATKLAVWVTDAHHPKAYRFNPQSSCRLRSPGRFHEP